MKRMSVLLVVIGIVIGLAVGLWFYDKGMTKVYKVYEFSLEK